jgi:two-component system chemotaxis response regulator CheY
MRNIVKNTVAELKLHCHFLEAQDGEEALQKLLVNQVDMILLDWNMPHLSGIDFLKKVRAMAVYQSLPIIMVTSEAAKYSVLEALKEGASDYIIKPIQDKTFFEKVSKFIR